MQRAALAILDAAAFLITGGGLYDVFTPRLPANLRECCGENERARDLTRALLRALGGCLVGIGVAVAVLANLPAGRGREWPLALILILVLPAEGLNALGMRRAGSPYYFPLAFIGLTIAGVALASAGATP